MIHEVTFLRRGGPKEQKDVAPLAAYRDKNRVLLVFAPSTKDARFLKQNALLARSEAGMRERDLVRVNVFDTSGTADSASLATNAVRALRARYGVAGRDFRALLVGKDGHTAYASPRPVAFRDLFARIDRMPMRQAEMARQNKQSPQKPRTD